LGLWAQLLPKPVEHLATVTVNIMTGIRLNQAATMAAPLAADVITL
jgi:hypothetical protein